MYTISVDRQPCDAYIATPPACPTATVRHARYMPRARVKPRARVMPHVPGTYCLGKLQTDFMETRIEFATDKTTSLV